MKLKKNMANKKHIKNMFSVFFLVVSDFKRKLYKVKNLCQNEGRKKVGERRVGEGRSETGEGEEEKDIDR